MPRRHPLATWLHLTGQKPADLCRTVGISHTYLSLVLSGAKRPTADMARRLAEAANIPVADAFGLGDDGRPMLLPGENTTN